jgi:hypothetical protein
MEMVAVVLLCVRRTATLGALLCLAVMSNVMLLNYAYDVPVKLYATMIVLSAAVLVLYDVPRLLAVFVTNRSTAPATASPVCDHTYKPAWRWTIRALLVGSHPLVGRHVDHSRHATRDVTRPERVGDDIVRAGKASRSTRPEIRRWRRFVVDRTALRFDSRPARSSGVRGRHHHRMRTITFACSRGRRGEFRWTRTGDVLQLEGTFDSARVKASGHALNRSDYRLLRSGFHLITDR